MSSATYVLAASLLAACGSRAEPPSAAPASRELDALASCTSRYSCPAFDALAGLGGAAAPQLVAYISDIGNPEPQRGLVAILIGKAKVPGAGPRLVELGLASKDVTIQHEFLEAAGACGGDATFHALASQYDKENHGDMAEHLVELLYGLKAFPAQAKSWAMGAMPRANDQVKYIDVIVAVAESADRDVLVALVATAKDQMAKHRLAAKAIALGASDAALWDVFITGLSSSVNYERDDAGQQLQDIADKIPADKRAPLVDLIKKALASENDPMLQGGLERSLAKLGG